MGELNFTKDAREALRLAQLTARELGHGYVGSEHLLLGLVRRRCGAARLLKGCGVSEEALRSVLVGCVGEGAPGNDPAQGLTLHARGAVEEAGRCAAEAGGEVDTTHLLLGLLKGRQNMACRLLRMAGADPDELYVRICAELRGMLRKPSAAERQGEAAAQENRSKLLRDFTVDLNQLAREGKLDPVIGREKELRRTMEILCRRTKNNPVLIGEPGVGKTAVAEGLAQRIVAREAPGELLGKRVLSLDIASLVAGTKFRGEFEDRLRRLIADAGRDGGVILFVDELHNIVGAGNAEGAVDAANILKPVLARGALQLVGATTFREYRRFIEKDGALERRFQTVQVAEPTEEQSLRILRGLREHYEEHHHLSVSEEALEAAVKLSRRYLTGRCLPDKAIDLVDEAAACVAIEREERSCGAWRLKEKLRQLQEEKAAAEERGDAAETARLSLAERDFAEQLSAFSSPRESCCVEAADIAAVISEWTGIPVQRLTERESQRLLRLEERLRRRVIGQEKAVAAVAKAIRLSRAGLKDPKRPVGTFLFLGPSGVGKTELARALAEELFGEEKALIRFDMSEYADKGAVSRMVGAAPGYVGYEEGGRLTDQIRRRPYSVVLFDEIEKADGEIWNLLLQVLEDGRVTDGQGREANFCNAVLILTSNVGSERGSAPHRLGFAEEREEDAALRLEKSGEEALRRTFPPEFLGRLDETVVFQPLKREELERVAEKLLRQLNGRLREIPLQLSAEPEALALLARQSEDRRCGARPLRRLIRRGVEEPLAEMLLAGGIEAGDEVRLAAEGEGLRLRKKETCGAAVCALAAEDVNEV